MWNILACIAFSSDLELHPGPHPGPPITHPAGSSVLFPITALKKWHSEVQMLCQADLGGRNGRHLGSTEAHAVMLGGDKEGTDVPAEPWIQDSGSPIIDIIGHYRGRFNLARYNNSQFKIRNEGGKFSRAAKTMRSVFAAPYHLLRPRGLCAGL